jgi:hypothetical protein
MQNNSVTFSRQYGRQSRRLLSPVTKKLEQWYQSLPEPPRTVQGTPSTRRPNGLALGQRVLHSQRAKLS